VRAAAAIVLADERPLEEAAPGLRRKAFFTDRLTLVYFEVTKTPGQADVLRTHSHHHDQITLIVAGRARAQVGSVIQEVGPGAVIVAPSNVPHGLLALSDQLVAIDTFTPTRDDFRSPPIVGINDAKSFVYQWFSWFDRQVDESLFLDHLAREGLVMQFPEATLRNHEEFRHWYRGIRKTIASNTHELGDLQVARPAGCARRAGTRATRGATGGAARSVPAAAVRPRARLELLEGVGGQPGAHLVVGRERPVADGALHEQLLIDEGGEEGRGLLRRPARALALGDLGAQPLLQPLERDDPVADAGDDRLPPGGPGRARGRGGAALTRRARPLAAGAREQSHGQEEAGAAHGLILAARGNAGAGAAPGAGSAPGAPAVWPTAAL
jgi:quercetin dioxygenase-like cupin family protein